MIHAKITFTATVVFSGQVDELPTVQQVLDMLANHELDVDPVDAHSTIGHNFVIMVKPKGQKPEEIVGNPEDIPF